MWISIKDVEQAVIFKIKDMTQEEKQLLLIDLCMRIPHHTLVCLNPGAYGKPETCLLCGIDDEQVYLNVDSDPFRIDHIKPYLRPMSSMTEEEAKDMGLTECLKSSFYVGVIDWLNAHHFDYRGLIEKSLAIVAPEGMYKTE